MVLDVGKTHASRYPHSPRQRSKEDRLLDTESVTSIQDCACPAGIDHVGDAMRVIPDLVPRKVEDCNSLLFRSFQSFGQGSSFCFYRLRFVIKEVCELQILLQNRLQAVFVALRHWGQSIPQTGVFREVRVVKQLKAKISDVGQPTREVAA